MLYVDFRHALRSLIRMPVFAAICILTLALGIGATTSIFTALYHTVMRPMPFEGGERMGYVWMEDSVSKIGISPSKEHVAAWQKGARLFDGIEGFSGGEYTLLGGAEPEMVHGARITRGLADMLGVRPVLGRGFTEEDMKAGGPNVAVLSEGLWRRRFGGAKDLGGREVQLLDGRKFQVVGVMPDVFAAFDGFSRDGQIWFPLRPDTSEGPGTNPIVLMKEGVTLEAAAAELGVLSAGLKMDNHGSVTSKFAPSIMTQEMMLDGTTKAGLPILFYAVCGVLLIACANIAGLLLVRLHSRERELAIRSAIGAQRWTIVRLLVVEAFVLAIAGGAVGVLIAAWLTGVIRAIRPESMSGLDASHLNGVTLAFAAAISLITATLFVAAPVIGVLRRSLTNGLITGAGSSGRVTSSNTTRSVMVAGQIALSLVLLVGSLVLVRSVQKLQGRDLGFNAANVLTTNLRLPDDAGFTEATRRTYLETLKPQLEKLPGVQSVSLSTGLPTSGGVMFGGVMIKGRELGPEEQRNYVSFTGVSPAYVETIGLRLREGRFLQDNEIGSPIVINESWAKQLWPGGTAVGRELKIGDGEDWMTIVGVVADVKGHGPGAKGTDPHIYAQHMYGFHEATVAIRTVAGTDPTSLVTAVRRAVSGLNGKVLADDIATLEALTRDTIAMNRFYMRLLSSFAVLALVLSVIGLYGVISNTVVQRTREIGVRMALGATPHDVQQHVIGQGMRIALLGILIGCLGAWFAVMKLEATLYGFNARDPLSFAGAVLALAAGALFATWLPSRRAVRIDPLEALRSE